MLQGLRCVARGPLLTCRTTLPSGGRLLPRARCGPVHSRSFAAGADTKDDKSGLKRWLGWANQNSTFTFRDRTLDEILKTKATGAPGQLWTVGEDDSALDAVKILAQNKIGAVMVRNTAGKYVGIFSERDYINKVEVRGHKSADIKVGKLMVKNISFVKSNETVVNCLYLMNRFGFRHLPVKHPLTNDVIGMISIRDLIRAIMMDAEEESLEKRRNAMA